MHPKKILLSALAASAALVVQEASAEVVALYDFNTFGHEVSNPSTPSSVTSPLAGVSNLERDPGGEGNADALGTLTLTQPRHPAAQGPNDPFPSTVLGIGPGTTARNPFHATTPTAIVPTQDYVAFTLTSNVDGLEFTSLSLDFGASVRSGDSTGLMGALQLFVAINGGAFNAVGDAQERIVPAGAPGTFTGLIESVIDLSGLAALNNGGTAEFRIAFGDNSSAPTADKAFYIDNIAVNAVPEPASLALLGLAGLCIFGRRRD